MSTKEISAAAQALGRRGGLKSLGAKTPAELSAFGKAAAQKRWAAFGRGEQSGEAHTVGGMFSAGAQQFEALAGAVVKVEPPKPKRPLPTVLLDAIDRSRSLLDMGDDWDGEGAVGYKASTLERATSFLKFLFASNIGARFDVPNILAGPDGSIDIHWYQSSYELLINIPVDPREPAEFYGDNKDENPSTRIKAKGTIDITANRSRRPAR